MFFIHVLTTLTVGLWTIIEGTKELIEIFRKWRERKWEEKHSKPEDDYRPSFHSDNWKYL